MLWKLTHAYFARIVGVTVTVILFPVCSLQLELEEMTALAPHQQHTNEDVGQWDFLRQRGVPEEDIDQMQQDRVIL